MFFESTQETYEVFQPLRDALAFYLSDVEIESVYQAFLFSAYYHQGQKRFSGEPYITHPVAVALCLAQWSVDVESLQAGLLHDLIEDTSVDKALLTEHFGVAVADIVDGVSKLKHATISLNTRLEAQAENFMKMFLAMAKDLRVLLVKLADRLHNMRTLYILPKVRAARIARETLDIYAPIAHRIGMHAVALELQDLGFSALYPDRSRILKAAVLRVQGAHLDIFKEIETRFYQQFKVLNISVQGISSRSKNVYSIYCKMRDKNLPFSKIMDVYAVRIVTNSVDACYRILGVIHNAYKPVPGRVKDYIALPKSNGYQSLHTVLFGPYGVPIEVQIRTHQMDLNADAGVAAHWEYKINSEVETQPKPQQLWIQRLMEIQSRTLNSLEFFENVKVDLFPDEVYVFTPKGDIISLPAGATAVDFAYAVHTDIGNHCVAVKIDRQLSPLSSTLSNGYTVEVITADTALPNTTWLEYVCTAKARSSIRHYLKHAQREQSICLGKQLLSRSLVQRGLDLNTVNQECASQLVARFQVNAFEELLEDLALGRRIPHVVAGQLQCLMGQEDQGITQSEAPLVIAGTEGMAVTFAQCCYPVPGDLIVGHLISEAGLEIHHLKCKQFNERRVLSDDSNFTMTWALEVSGDYHVQVCVDAENQRGILAQLALAVSDSGSSIVDVSVKVPDGVNVCINLRF